MDQPVNGWGRAARLVPLAILSGTEMLVAFARMLVLTHVLGPYELGFASAISATYAAIEQITDTAIFRFVMSSARGRYREALDTAHTISFARGVVMAAALLALSGPFATAMATPADWTSFAWLAPIALLRGFENLEVRIWERDYRYAPQLLCVLGSHLPAFAVLVAVSLGERTHIAIIAYLFVQAFVSAGLTNLVAKTPYRVRLKPPMFGAALAFSAPLLMNGVGNAMMAQGDRLMVASLLDLETLGLYAVILLTAVVPTSALFRFVGPILFAGLHHAEDDPGRFEARLKLYSRAMPLLGALYAVGWMTLCKPLMPLIFSSRFVPSDLSVALVGMILYLRICRTDPAMSILIHAQATRRLALASQALMIGLALGTLFVLANPVLESALIGSLCGELATVIAGLGVGRRHWRGAWLDAVATVALAAAIPAAVGVTFLAIGATDAILARLAIGTAGAVATLVAATVFVLPLRKTAYPATSPRGPHGR